MNRKNYLNYFQPALENYTLPAYVDPMSIPKEVSNYMKQIGSNGGKKSKRVLTPEQSAAMRAKRKPNRQHRSK